MACDRAIISNLQSRVFPFLQQTSVDNEFYEFVCASGNFQIPRRYTDLQLVGQGSNGSVCKAIDSVTAKAVAIKKFHYPFSSDKQTLMVYRELTMLQHMCHPNVIFMVHAFTPAENPSGFHNNLYFVMPYVDDNLGQLTKGPWEEESTQWIIYQILRGLKYLHSAGIIHRDLKPSNIGVVNCTPLRVRILDFGMARSKGEQMTGYVCTRHYRAPEVFLHWMQYCEKADLWSVGCIMAFMLSGRCLFEGNSYGMTKTIVEVLGRPDEDFMKKVEAPAAEFLNGLGCSQPLGLRKMLPRLSEDAFKLLSHMLVINPCRRCSVEEALESAFVNTFHRNINEFTSEPIVIPYEESRLSVHEYKDLLWKLLCDQVPKFERLVDDVD